MFQKRLGALAIFMMAIQWMGISQQNVGIGTNTPAAKLHVRSQHSGTQIVLEETSTAAFLRMSAEPNNTGPYIGTTSNHRFSLVANNQPVVYLTTTGNVGIGTNNPTAKLHVRSQLFGTQIVLEETSTAAFLRMSAEPNNTGPYIGTTSNHQFSLVANNVPVIYLTTTGNVGIGLDNPQQRVGIRGGMVLDQDNQNTGTLAYTLKFGNNSGEAIGSKRNAGNNQFGLDFYTNNLHRMTIANNGNVGIGTSNPQSTLEIAVGNGRQFGFRNDIIPTLEITSTNPNDPLAGIMRVRNAIELFPNAAGTVAAKMDIRNKQGNPTIELNGDNGEIKARNMPGVRHRFTSRVNNIIGQTGSIVLESMRVNIPMAGMIKISANFFVAARGTNIVNMDYQINDNTPGQFTTLRNVNVNHEDATGHYYIEWVGFVQPGNKLYELKVFNKSNQHDLAFTVSAITVEFLGRELADW